MCVEQVVEGEGHEDGLGEKTCVWSKRLKERVMKMVLGRRHVCGVRG